MSDYNQLKNAAILNPTTNTDLGSNANRYSNVFLSGNIVMSNGVTVTSTNVITPKISSITYLGDDTATAPAGGQTITVTGTGFSNTASVLIGSSPASLVTVLSSTSITFTAPARTAGTYTLYVINSDGGTAIYIPGINYSGTPNWSTTSGSLATVYETNSINTTVSATSDSATTYSVFSGTLPTGSSLNTSSGLISGTAPVSSGTSTYNFTIRATDAENQDTDRNFSITVNTDAVTWNSPADNTTTNLDLGTAMTNVAMSATSAAGKSITFAANSLPTGVTISGANITGTPTASGSTTSVITATATGSNRTATRTFNWVVSVAADAYWMYTTVLLNGDGDSATDNANNNTFKDSSTNNFTVTRVQALAQGTFTPYSASSWSNYFNGSSLTVPTNSGLDLGSGAYTVEAWFNAGTTAGQLTIISFLTGLKITVIPSLSYLRVWGDAGNTYQNSDTVTINIGQWYHVAWVRQSTSLGKLYLNGALILTITSGVMVSSTPTGQNVLIGTYGDGFGNGFNGYISNLRVVKGTAVYTSAFTPPTTPLTAISGTTLLTCQFNRFIDNSTTNAALTFTGTPSVEKFNPFNGTASYSPSLNGGSCYFNGSNGVANEDSLAVAMTGQALGTGNFTIECWTYLPSTGFINGGCVFAIFDSGTLQMLLRPENNVYWRLNYNSGANIDLSTSLIVNNRWIHHAVVRISGTTKYYQDGILIGSGVDTFNYTGTTLKIANYADYNMKGFVSDFRIVKGTGVYTTSFTPPTQALTAVSGTSVLLSFTNSGIIDQTGTSNFMTVGNGSSTISTSVKKFGTGSISYAGTGGWVAPQQPNPLLRLGPGDWTLEFWLRIPDTSKSATWIVSWGGDPRLNLDNAALTWYTTGVARTATGNVLTANTWQHVAVVKYSGNTKIYVDGTQSGSAYSDANTYSTANMDAIGFSPFTGYIDDFRLTKGYARYTANFTPPTAKLSTR